MSLCGNQNSQLVFGGGVFLTVLNDVFFFSHLLSLVFQKETHRGCVLMMYLRLGRRFKLNNKSLGHKTLNHRFGTRLCFSFVTFGLNNLFMLVILLKQFHGVNVQLGVLNPWFFWTSAFGSLNQKTTQQQNVTSSNPQKKTGQ